jgi:hypothetical protein
MVIDMIEQLAIGSTASSGDFGMVSQRIKVIGERSQHKPGWRR